MLLLLLRLSRAHDLENHVKDFLLILKRKGTFLWCDPNPRSHGSWYIKGTDESTLVTDSSVSLMYHDPSDLGSLTLIQITTKERALSLSWRNLNLAPPSSTKSVENGS